MGANLELPLILRFPTPEFGSALLYLGQFPPGLHFNLQWCGSQAGIDRHVLRVVSLDLHGDLRSPVFQVEPEAF